MASRSPGFEMKSNLSNPPSRGRQENIVIYIMLPITTVLLFLRLYVRARIQRAWGGDDVLAVISTICLGGYCGLLIYLVDGPVGEHIWDIPISSITDSVMKANLAAQCLYPLSSIFTKCSLLFLYLRVFSPSQRAVHMIWIGIAFILVSHIAGGVAQIGLLIPRPGESWMDTSVSSKVQKGGWKIIVTQGILSVVTDFYVLFIPMSLVTGLHLPTGRKAGVCAIFMTGLIACICSLVGAVYRFRLRHSRDMFWDAIPAYILTVIELSTGIICSCMPVFPVLAKYSTKSKSYQYAISFLRHFCIYFRMTLKHRNNDKEGQLNEEEDSYRFRMQILSPKTRGSGTSVRCENRGDGQLLGPEAGFSQLDSIEDDYHAQLKVIKE